MITCMYVCMYVCMYICMHVVVVVSHIQRIGCQPEKNYFTRWPIADGSVEFCEATPIGLVDEPKVSLYGRETDHLRSACRCVA